jgi:putative tricarboxylic transport membrane protein
VKPSLPLNAISAAVCFAFGAAVAWSAALLPMGSLRAPGPGAFPLAIGLCLMLLAAALLLPVRPSLAAQEMSEPDEDQPEPWGRARVALVCALVALFVVALPVIGFLAATTLLMIAFYVIGADGRVSLAPVFSGLLTAAAAYALFVLLLDVALPRGWRWGL